MTLKFEDYNEECVWRNNQGRTYHTIGMEEREEDEYELVNQKRRGRVIGDVYFCGVLGIKCEEKICAPFYFVKKTAELSEKGKEKFLEEL